MKTSLSSAIKIVTGLVIALPAISFAGTPVTDTEVVNELKQIREQLMQNAAKAYTCTDGEKNYTAGIFLKFNNSLYKCEMKGDHAEWQIQIEAR